MLPCLLAGTLGACQPPAHSPEEASKQLAQAETRPWAAVVGGARRAPDDPVERALSTLCGEPDAVLTIVASYILESQSEPEVDDVIAELRRRGDAHVGPRWAVGTNGTREARVTKLFRPQSACGVAIRGARWAAVAVDAVAELEPLPSTAHSGQWFTARAHLTTPGRSARVLLSPESGAPQELATYFDGRSIRAAFTLPQPGRFTLQVVADLGHGPRPVLEAALFADVEPSGARRVRVPEETGEDESALDQLIARVRAAAGAGPLTRDQVLDVLAKKHADAMREKGLTAHDVGKGDLRERMGEEGAFRQIGENVAHSSTLANAHRALYDSPSHRMNLLSVHYTKLGLGIARAPDSVYVCEVFAGD